MPNPFEKPTTPKNSLQLLLEWYNDSLSKIRTLLIVLKANLVNLFNFFVVIISLTLVIYAISVVIASFYFPLIFPLDALENNEVFVQKWQTYSTWWEKVYFFANFDNYNSLRGLVFYLAFYLAFSLAFSLAIVLLNVALARSLDFGLVEGLVLGLVFASVIALAFGLVFGLGFGLAIGITGGLVIGLAIGLDGGLAFLICFYITYFRLWLYPWHFLKSLFPVTLLFPVSLTNNPYIGDGTIWLPIWGMTRKLTAQAQEDPENGLKFVNFLQEYRPLQKQLAMHIAHAATAGNWKYHPLQKQSLLPPPLIQETPRLTPSESWLNQIDKLKRQFGTYDEENQITLKKNQFETFCTQLDKFRDLTTYEPYRWHHYYLPAIDQWQSASKEKLAELTQTAQSEEPITHNIYRFGEILDPKKDQDIFFGREDIKMELKQQILTARTMPMFLCYGQRRVGKSSLLKFLPQLLGSCFQVIYQNCQDGKVNSLYNWLEDLEQQLNKTWKSNPIDWQSTDNWLETWVKMQNHLETLSQQHDEKIILAFDEYESLHERIFTDDPKQGKMLLEAMRSFSQHQNQVVFLFVGAAQFVDLTQPNWDRCFIHAMPLKVDYLCYKDATRLITEPVDLNYPTAVIERMWAVTQGHPALLQMLCRQMVKIANTEIRKDMTLADLEQVITKEIIQRGTNALNTFWTEFCSQNECQSTIEKIINNQKVTDKKSRLKLEDYGYIIPDGENWKLRVPLLEMWLRRYREGF
jgi:hypothetical protein